MALTVQERDLVIEFQRRGLTLPPKFAAYVQKKVQGPEGQAVPERYIEYLPLVGDKGWDFQVPHIVLIADALDRMTRGEVRNLGIFIPPRHAKTDTVSYRYPVYRLERDRRLRVALGGKDSTFAKRFGKRARRLVKARGVELMEDSQAVESWETAEGGTYRSFGVGNCPTGEGFDLIIIEDPYPSRKKAESPTYRQEVSDWFADVWQRREPGAQVIVIHTLWHEEDLGSSIMKTERLKIDTEAGILTERHASLVRSIDGEGVERESLEWEDGWSPERVQEEARRVSDWEFIRLPAIAEENDPLGRQPGEALWPARYSAFGEVPGSESLAAIRIVQGEYNWAALYQQRPSPREGSFFRPGMIEVVGSAPRAMDIMLCFDLGDGTAGSDFTAGVALAGPDGDGYYYVLDAIEVQLEAADRNRVLRHFAERVRDRWITRPVIQRRMKSLRVGYPQDPGQAGKGQVRSMSRIFAGFATRKFRPDTNKLLRADPVAAQVNAGNFRIVWDASIPWGVPGHEYSPERFRARLQTFPREPDDLVDALSDAFAGLDTTPGDVWEW